jgi:hypothetical protein
MGVSARKAGFVRNGPTGTRAEVNPLIFKNSRREVDGLRGVAHLEILFPDHGIRFSGIFDGEYRKSPPLEGLQPLEDGLR